MSSSDDKQVRVHIEIGHKSICRDVKTPNGFTHDWSIEVRGTDGNDISHFVEKVVFLLHESFPKPKRVCKEPPYTVSESGYGSFNLPVEIYFRSNKEEPRKHRIEYDLFLQLVGKPPVDHSKVEALTFLNPSEEFQNRLLKGGATILPHASPSAAPPVASPPVVKPTEPPPATRSLSPSSSLGSSPGSHKKVHKSLKSAQTKRSLPSSAEEDAQKTKKKIKSDRSDSTTPLPSSKVKEVPLVTPAVPASTARSETPVNETKKSHKKERSRERHKSTTENSLSSPKSSKKESKTRGKEMKQKREKLSSPESVSSVKDENNLPKLKIKRMAADHYVTANGASNGNDNNNLQTSKSQSVASTNVNDLLKEFAQEGSDDDIEFPSEITKIESTESLPLTSLRPSPVTVKPINSKPKKSKIHKSNVNGERSKLVNGDASKKEDVKYIAKPERAMEAGKTLPSATTTMGALPNSPPLGNKKHLVELYKLINQCEDDEVLQKVVDIVEECGQFAVSQTTFDFDLCALPSGAVESIRRFLQKT